MEFEDLCWFEGVFEKLLLDARKARSKKAVEELIRVKYQEIKEAKFGYINSSLVAC